MYVVLSEGVLKVRKLFIVALALLGATGANAAVVNGFSDVTNNGDGTLTFIFDTATSAAAGDGSGDGLLFSDGVLNILVQSAQGTVRQEPAENGGLGVLATDGSGTDGLDTGLGETLKLSFSSSVEIVNFTFNGLIGVDEKTAAAEGGFKASVLGSIGSIEVDASTFDGIEPDVVDFFSLCGDFGLFCNTTTLLFSASDSNPFKGYLESVTVRVNAVPVPASLGLLGLGMAGLGLVARKRRKVS
jgi:hypothetical protein